MKPIPVRTWQTRRFRLRLFDAVRRDWQAKPEDKAPAGMVPCTVESHYSAWLVTFDNTASLLLQSDYDQAAFAVACGAIAAAPDWDGTPSALGDAWAALEPSAIEWCPDDYLALATKGTP